MANQGMTEQAKQGLTLALPSSRTVLRVLISVAFLFPLMHWVSQRTDLQILQGHWLMGEESTIPTWWSAIQLLALAALLSLVALKQGETDRNISRTLWVMAAGFAFFSVDEVATIHESITIALVEYEAVPRFTGGHGIWIFVYGLVGIGVLAWIAPGLIRYFQKDKRHTGYLIAGTAILLLGAVGVEILGYIDEELVSLEETLEILGVSIMVWSTYRALDWAEVAFSSRLDRPPESERSESTQALS